MRRRCFLSLLMVALAAVPSLASAANNPQPVRGWHHDIASAVRDVEQLDVPLVMHFHASWCGPCKRMDQEVLSSNALREHFGRRLVGVKVDADQHPELLEKFGVGSLPTDLILDPNGKVLARMKGYQEPREYLGRLARAEASYASERKVRIARQRSSEPTKLHLSRRSSSPAKDLPHGGIHEPEANSKPPGDGSLNLHEGMLVGLGGYSPVALFNFRRWKKGDPSKQVRHEGILYRFADREEQETFLADPEKYAPQMLGCDPVVLFETDRAISGSTRFAAYFEGRLHLFVSSATRDRFQENADRYASYRHALRVEDIEGTVVRQASSEKADYRER